MEQSFDLRVYINLLKRRFFHIVIPAALIFAAVCVAAYKWPPVYEATATILVASQQIPNELAQTTVPGGSDERIRVIEQRLMTRENILDVARKFNLYAHKDVSPTEKVDLFREATIIDRIAVGVGQRGGGQAIAFNVSFQYGSGGVAAQVANELSTRILEQNIQSRSDRATQTAAFFSRFVSQLEKKMAEQSAKIIQFKKEHQDSLPELLDFRRQQLTSLTAKRAALFDKIEAYERQLELVRQNGGEIPVNDAQQRLQTLQNELVQLRAFYTDTHPSVKRVLVQISALEAAGQPTPRPKPEQGDSGEAAAENTIDDPRLLTRISFVETDIESMRTEAAAIEEQITALTQSIEKTPETGLALSDMERELENIRAEYRGVINKRVAAETGERLEEDRQAERFEIIDSATAPSEPVKPDRQKIILAGFVGSGAVGVGLALLLELLNSGIRSSADLVSRLQIKPIVSIPYIETREDRRKKYRRWTIIGLLILLVPPVLLASIHYYYKPLDILYYTTLQKFGL